MKKHPWQQEYISINRLLVKRRPRRELVCHSQRKKAVSRRSERDQSIKFLSL